MKSPDEVLDYLNKRDDRVDYQVHHNLLRPWIYIQYPNDVLLCINAETRRVAFDFNQIEVKELKEMEQLLQQLQQTIQLAKALEKFLQSP